MTHKEYEELMDEAVEKGLTTLQKKLEASPTPVIQSLDVATIAWMLETPVKATKRVASDIIMEVVLPSEKKAQKQPITHNYMDPDEALDADYWGM
jgi:hypothetical protein